MGGVPSDVLAQHNHGQRETAKTIEQSFEKAATARNPSHDWRHKALNDTEVLGDIIHQARIADLVVACVNDKSDPLSSFHDVPIRLVLETGRPVLLVPANTQMKTVGQRIIVAWNHSRESARAVSNALALAADDRFGRDPRHQSRTGPIIVRPAGPLQSFSETI